MTGRGVVVVVDRVLMLVEGSVCCDVVLMLVDGNVASLTRDGSGLAVVSS